MSTGAASDERESLEAAIAALTAQRALLGDAVVDVALAPLRAKLDALDASASASSSASEARGQALRLVTIVFLDVVGSTVLSQSLDAEDMHAILDGTLARCTAIVGAHDGRVLQYAGDSLLAVFGVDGAREDDAERAVRAGLALLAEGRACRASVSKAHGYDGYDVRVGAHTGRVLLGGGVDADASIRGATVHVAARMEQSAPPGAMRISRDTWRQVRDCFECEPQAPLAVKGIDGPVATYLVLRETPRTFDARSTGLEPIEGAARAQAMRMIGRDAELARIDRLFDEARLSRTSRVFTVIADAGVGKSRFLCEVERRLDSDPAPRGLVFHGRARRHGSNVPYGVLRDLLARHGDILESDPVDVARAKLVATFGSAFGERAAEQAALVGQLVGIDFSDDPHIAGIVRDGRQIKARAFHAFAAFLRARCDEGRPVALLLDDLHWADDGSLELVEHVAAQCASMPIVIGVFARPALDERRPGWRDDASLERIELQLLSDADGRRLVDALLQREGLATEEVPDELRAFVVAHAGGNPFHVQELLGMLVDDGIVTRDAGGWRVDRSRLSRAKVPATLTALLQTRLDALPANERLALQHDSVVGQVFWDEALREIVPASVAALDALVARELVQAHEDSAFASTREFQFKHHLLHQVTYDTVLKAARRELHRRTAEWLEAVTGDRVGEHLGLIADHYERADDATNAVRYLIKAADAAYRTASFSASIDYADRALARVNESDVATRFELHATRANAMNAMGRRAEQAIDAAEATRLAERLGDDRSRARAARQEAQLCLLRGDYACAIDFAERAERWSARIDDADGTVGARLERGQALVYLGRFDEAEACLRSVLEPAAVHGLRDREIVALNRLNAIEQTRGRWDVAVDYIERALASSRATHNRRFEGALLGNLGILHTALGRFDRARDELETGLAISRAIDDRGSEPYGTLALSIIALEEGRAADALEQLASTRALAREVGDRGIERSTVMRSIDALATLERDDEALDLCDELDALEEASGHEAVLSLVPRARLALRAGRLDHAEALALRIGELLDAPSSSTDFDRVAQSFMRHRVLAAAGRHDAADAELVRAYETLTAIAATLDDAGRAAYFENVRAHRGVVDAWTARLATMS